MKKNPQNEMGKILEITALTLKSVQIDLNNLWKQSTADYLRCVASCVAKKATAVFMSKRGGNLNRLLTR